MSLTSRIGKAAVDQDIVKPAREAVTMGAEIMDRQAGWHAAEAPHPTTRRLVGRARLPVVNSRDGY